MNNVDQDGFSTGAGAPVKAPPEAIEVPKFFDGCGSIQEAAVKAMNALAEPYSSGLLGTDEMYTRISNALIVLLANAAGVRP